MTRTFISRAALALALLSTGLAAQAQDGFRCGTDEMRRKAIAADPSILQREAELEHFTRQWLAEHNARRDADTVILTIPVVFHVVHMNGPENISTEQILDAMEVLNRDYRKLNEDLSDVCCGFQDIAGDIHLEFKLATIDPEGNCTNGIDRIRSCETFVGDNGSKLNWWPRNKYLNVWTVQTIRSGAAGYSQYPSAVEGPNAPADGTLLLHDYIGRIGSGAEFKSRALTHEVGHWLNLKHVWGDNNGEDGAPQDHMSPTCGDDAVDDTPWTRGWNICPTPAQSKNCSDTIFENFQNYMEYSYCSMMFTEGQNERMRAALASGLAERDNLWTPETLAATGTDGLTDQHCAPVADFYCFNDAIATGNPNTPQGTDFYCIGDQVSFFDNSQRAMPDSWQWTFQDGEPSTSTDRNPTVSFNSGGWKTVSLTVSNAQGSSTRVNEFSVFISYPWSVLSGAVQEDFEGSCADCYWFTNNYDADESFWHHVSNAGHSGGSSMMLNAKDSYGINDYFIDEGADDIDALVTPDMDLTWLQNGEFSFWYAYAVSTTDMEEVTEKLEIWSSTNCGRNWQLRKTIDEEDIITAGTTSAPFVPGSPAVWQQESFNLASSFATDHVRFKFVFYSGEKSNNLYIDDVNITGTVGFNDLQAGTTGLTVMPNPTEGEVSVVYALSAPGKGRIAMLDAQGREVWSRATRDLAQERVTIDTRALGLAAGVYTVRLAHETGQRVERLVVR